MHARYYLAGVVFAILFGFTFMFSKTALDVVRPIGLIAYRFLIAFFTFEVIRQLKLVVIRFERVHLKPVLIVVLFQPVLYFLFETYGLDRTTSGEAGMMIALIPIFVTIASALLLREKPTRLQLFFIILSVSGILLIQFARSRGDIDPETIGFLLLLGAVISAALFNIASRSASKTMKPQELTYFMMLFGAVIFNAIYIVTLIIEGTPLDYVRNLREVSLVVPLIYLGVFASIGGFFLVNVTLKNMPAHVSSIFANLATVVAITAGYVFLNESLYWYHFVGSAMILIGVYGTVRLNQRVKRLSQPSKGYIER